jgi:uncharacterized membrane protein
MKRIWQFFVLFIFGIGLGPVVQPVHAQQSVPEAVVRAVLFYSPTCSHCHHVINEVLPPLFEQYGDRLNVIGVDVTQPGGQALFQNTMLKFGLESSGVPLLVVNDVYLVGSIEIPGKFPDLIEHFLAQGGTDWPDIPGLADVLALDHLSEEKNSSLMTNFTRDPLGNSLAVIVLVGMVISVGRAIITLRKKPRKSLARPTEWAIPILCIFGVGVAGYLAFVEMAQVTAVCGPIGDCNTVQQSEYARLFGVFPIGVLGLMGYIAILAAWLVRRFARGRPTDLAALALLGMTAFGTLFSIYLIILEPFVIGATCAWCLTSAIIITLMLWLALPSGRQAIIHLTQGDSRV